MIKWINFLREVIFLHVAGGFLTKGPFFIHLSFRLHDKASHLLNIDRDLCHKVHNAVKVFCKPFDKYLEHLWRDIHNDVKFSADIKTALQELCLLLGLHYTKPLEPVAHRWLSVYTVTSANLPMYDAFFLLYYSWLSKEDKVLHNDEKNSIISKAGVTGDAIKSVEEILKKMSKKGLTKKGKARKARIFEKVIFKREKSHLIAHFYNSVLPMFKSFVLIFEQKTPQVHRIHWQISELTREFLSCFVKHESVKRLTGSKLKQLPIKNELRKTKDFYIGSSTEKVARKLRREKKDDIVKKSFLETAIYMQQKFPLSNKLLMSLTGLDPEVMGRSPVYVCLKRLSEYFPTILTDMEQKESYLREVSRIQLDLPPVKTDENLPMQLNLWWAMVFKSGKYPTLSLIVKACLSIFSGPHVEASFSRMNDIIDKKSNRMGIDTYSEIINVKYSLQATSSSALYRRSDPIHDPVNKNLCYYIRIAHARFKKRSSVKKQTIEKKQKSAKGIKV